MSYVHGTIVRKKESAILVANQYDFRYNRRNPATAKRQNTYTTSILPFSLDLHSQ
jgi:hypothetical protein